MPQLISLTATQRKFQGRIDWQDFASTIAVDIDDIVSPIRRDTVNSVSYFTTRQMKGAVGGTAVNNAKVDYRVSDALANIAGKSDGLAVLSVVAINGTTISTEDMVFVVSRISEILVPAQGGGTIFRYVEDGNPNTVQYQVGDSIASIITQLQTTGSPLPPVRNGLDVNGGFVELGGALVHDTTIDLNGFELGLLNILVGVAGTDNILVVDGTGNIKFISGNSYAVNSAALNVIPKSDGANGLVTSNIADDGTDIILGINTFINGSILDAPSGNTSLDPLTRILGDVTGASSVDWANRRLIESATTILDWSGTFADVTVFGTTNDATQHAFRVYNSTPTEIFSVLNDGTIKVHGGNGFNGTFEIHQKAGTTHILSVYNTSYSKQMLTISDNGSAGQVFIGDGVLQVNAYGGVGIGIAGPGPGTQLRVNCVTPGADSVAFTGFGGNGGVYFSDNLAGDPFIYMQDAAAQTKVKISTDGDSFLAGGSVGFGTLTPSAVALIDMVSTTKGIRIPNMTTAQKNAITAVESLLVYDTDLGDFDYFNGTAWESVGKFESLVIAVSDETTALTTGTGKVTFRMPFAMKLSGVRGSLTTAQSSGTELTVDINESGASILSTKLTFDNTEKTTTTATAPAVISDFDLADDAEITVDIDTVGAGADAAGLKIYLIGRRIS